MPSGVFSLKQQVAAIRQGAWTNQRPLAVNYLVVAGGGAGGDNADTSNGNGGGGAGGLLQGSIGVTTDSAITVTIGAGSGRFGTAGSDSVFGSITSKGGGTGSRFNNNGSYSGGSGGGGSSGSSYLSGAQGTVGQGNAGGTGLTTNSGGGGGGAGTVGLNAVTNRGGNGGSGIASDISGTRTTYAGGGGGGALSTGTVGAGGVGGGGAGNGTDAGANTGGGGGGSSNNGNAGTGGSGIVIVSYPGTTQWFTGGTVYYANGNVVHVFTSSGTLAPTTATPANSSYTISRSLRFNSADSAYLSRTPASATNRKTWTYSVWLKRGQLSASDDWRLLACRPSSGVYTLFSFINTGSGSYPNALQLVDNNGTSLATTPVYRDPSSWYHIVLAVDTTQATAANRVRIYVNGTEVTAFSASTYPSQNLDMQINTANAHNISRDPSTGVSYFDGYMTEINFIDGQQLTPSSFGETSNFTGVWVPKAYTGTYGTNGFYLNFSDNSNTTAATLGKDYSGNGNNWTPNNFSVSAGAGNDSLVDSPTAYGTDTGVGGEVRGNYCTMNPLASGTDVILRNGNLEVNNVGATNCASYATIGMSSGKWYCEWTAGSDTMVGISSSLNPNITYIGKNATSWGYYNNGNKYNNNTPVAYGASYTSGDVIGIAFDADAGTLVFYKNGTSQGTAYSSLTSGPYFFATGNGTTTTQSVNFGQRPFAYTAPSGYKALCTQNLLTPAVVQGDDYFNTVLYTGTGTTQSVTGVGFQPDWTWLKARSAAYTNLVTDAVRGAGKSLYTNATDAETTNDANGYLTSFDSNGFSLSGGNRVGANAINYVAWNWKANGAGSTNTAGSVTSTVSANTTAGFSIVTFTTPSSNGNYTTGHGLGVAPSMIITKSRSSTTQWPVWHIGLTGGASNKDYNIYLNLTNAQSSATDSWGSAAPNSTTFGVNVGTQWTGSIDIVAYCFAEVPGFSRFGSYTGNGSSDGPFVFCGFRPRYIMCKKSSGTSNWIIRDTARSPTNVSEQVLWANLSLQENGGFAGNNFTIDILSNGFKIRNTGDDSNGSGATYIFAAFAESPFKYALAR